MAATKPRVVRLPWARIWRDACALVDLINTNQPATIWSGIVAVTRGGLIPATIIAQKLDIRNVVALSASSYEGKERGEVKLHAAWSEGMKWAIADGRGWLVVDDLVDSGATARAVRGILPKARYVCLYAKPAGVFDCHEFVHRFPQDLWLEFPWERQA